MTIPTETEFPNGNAENTQRGGDEAECAKELVQIVNRICKRFRDFNSYADIGSIIIISTPENKGNIF